MGMYNEKKKLLFLNSWVVKLNEKSNRSKEHIREMRLK